MKKATKTKKSVKKSAKAPTKAKATKSAKTLKTAKSPKAKATKSLKAKATQAAKTPRAAKATQAPAPANAVKATKPPVSVDTSNLEEFQPALRDFLQELFPNVNIVEVIIEDAFDFVFDDPIWNVHILVDRPHALDPRVGVSVWRKMHEHFGDGKIYKFPVMYYMRPQTYYNRINRKRKRKRK